MKDDTVKVLRRPGMDRVRDHCNCCRHFTGISKRSCDAGVQYADVAIDGEFKYRYEGTSGPVYTVGRRWPCHHEEAEAFGVPPCPKADWPTREEGEADKAETDAMFGRVVSARKAIVVHIAETGALRSACKCPVCGGELHYSKSTYNGHIHAKCGTDGCVSWME